MASTIKVDNVQNQPGTNIVNKCGTTTTIGAGAGETINVCAATVNIGRCGGTVALAAGATQTGFGRTGTVDWQTGSIKTATFTAVNGEGYFADTSGGAFTINLPAGSAGAIVSVADYTRTFATYNLTISPNGVEKIGGVAGDVTLSTNGQSATFVYVDGTEGWINTQETQTSATGLTGFIMATGGTPSAGVTCGDFKVHTFTGPGTFCVTAIDNCTAANNEVSYVIVAGGGGGGNGDNTGGGGAGGFRESKSGVDVYSPASPLEGATNVTVTATAYPIVVGGGGAGGAGSGSPGAQGTQGDSSTFSCVTSAGGGGGGAGRPCGSGGDTGGNGGSAGGNGHQNSGGVGSGNTPSTSPAQGTNGGTGAGAATGPAYAGGAGGGATVVGAAGTGCVAGAGGTGATTSITGAAVARSGGGGGSGETGPQAGAGGTGGGGGGGCNSTSGTAGTVNTGGGGGGTGAGTPNTGGNGGSGTVIIRYKFQ